MDLKFNIQYLETCLLDVVGTPVTVTVFIYILTLTIRKFWFCAHTFQLTYVIINFIKSIEVFWVLLNIKKTVITGAIRRNTSQGSMLVCTVCHIHCSSISKMAKEGSIELENGFLCDFCKTDKQVKEKRVQFEQPKVRSSSTSATDQHNAKQANDSSAAFLADSSSIKSTSAMPGAPSAHAFAQQENSKSFSSFFRIFGSTKMASSKSMVASAGSSLAKEASFPFNDPSITSPEREGNSKSKSKSSFFSRFRRNSSFLPTGYENKAFDCVSAPMPVIDAAESNERSWDTKEGCKILEAENKRPTFIEFIAQKFRKQKSEATKPFINRVIVVGADCIAWTAGLLQDYSPSHEIIFEQANRGCLYSLEKIIDAILPMMVVIIQLGEIDMLKYEYGKEGLWAAKFESIITKLLKKRAFVYVSFLKQNLVTGEKYYDKAVHFNKLVKRITKRHNAHFINVLLVFWGQPMFFSCKGMYLSQVGDDVLLREWSEHIAELSHMRLFFLDDFFGGRFIPNQL